METIIGSSNWRLTIQRGAAGVTILRAATCDTRAALPDVLFDLPVIALADHALAPGAKPIDGEAVSLAGAPNSPDYDNANLRELTLPTPLGAVGDYALMNCRTLQTLRLADRPIDWGTGALMNCRALDTLILTREDDADNGALAYFAGELAGELDVSIVTEGKRTARLIFPEYLEEFEENGPAHHFDYKVYGAGQPYHRAFRSRKLNLYDYDAHYLADRYLRSAAMANRAYLHVILHCLLRHLAKKRGHDGALWDIACDAVVESILDDLNYPCLGTIATPARQKFLNACRGEMKVLTAEGIYRYLLRERLSEYELAQLQRVFFQDDHGFWDMEEERDQSQRQDESWKGVSERTQTAMETVLAGKAEGGEAVLEQVKIAARDDVDYRAFLRRFAAPREVMAVDGDAFDYIYYTYGLSHYGNMPLIEPPETKEERRVEQLVIAIDTSMSTNGALVREFLRCTYAILRSTETFTRRLDIHIIQCDDQVRSDGAVGDPAGAGAARPRAREP